MNWRKRKKLRKIAHTHGKSHYYEWKSVIKALCHLDLYMTYSKEGRSKSWRVLFGKKLENAVSEMCDRDKPVQLGYIDYLGIEKLKHNGPIKEFHEAVCECLRDQNPISEYHGIVEGGDQNEMS